MNGIGFEIWISVSSSSKKKGVLNLTFYKRGRVRDMLILVTKGARKVMMPNFNRCDLYLWGRNKKSRYVKNRDIGVDYIRYLRV